MPEDFPHRPIGLRAIAAIIVTTAFLVGFIGWASFCAGRNVHKETLHKAFQGGYTLGLICAASPRELACQEKSLATGGGL